MNMFKSWDAPWNKLKFTDALFVKGCISNIILNIFKLSILDNYIFLSQDKPQTYPLYWICFNRKERKK